VPDRLVVDLGADGRATVLSWPAHGMPEPLSPAAPLTWPLDAAALEDLRWYLEDYLLAPFGVWEDRGPAVAGKLAGWGEQAFESVFGPGPARDAYQRARDQGLELVFRSADPGLLALPWELMRDGSGAVALGKGGIARSLPVANAAQALEVPGGKLRVLMVISRPDGTRDVGYQMVARPLMARLEAVRGEVDLTVLRPPTLEALRAAVKRAADAGEPFHVVHFDGHGAMTTRGGGGAGAGQGRPAMMSGPEEGVLAFELPGGGSDLISAAQVAQVLAAGRVPVVVLNACQSGAVGKELEASVATALLRAGCSAVVAMAYSVYAVAAAEFMAEFYEALFAGGSVGEAVTAGRRRLALRDGRPSPRGDMPLADWLVPVHYLRAEVRFPQARAARPDAAPALGEMLDQISAAPTEAAADPLAPVDGVFVGRDDLFYQLETATRLQKVVALTGPGGTGKTELAKGFARWLRDTGGVSDPRLVVWHSFEPGVASFGLDGVVNGIGLEVFGADFARLEAPQRLAAVRNLLAQYRALLVWDNFESVREMPDPDGATRPLDEAEAGRLREFLDWIRDHSASTVVITSRAREDWLGEVRRIEVGGLNRTEAAQYAGHLLAPYPAAQARREQRSFGELLDWLDGHPLAMRLTLPRLGEIGPAELLGGLRGTVSLPGGDVGEGGRLSSLGACITYSFAHLGERARRLLPALSLLHGTADANLLMIMSSVGGAPERFAGAGWQEWAAVLEDAERVGLLAGIGAGMYRIHPALPGYLAASWKADEPDRYEQEREACEQSMCSAAAHYSRWAIDQIDSGNASMAYAITGGHRRTLGTMLSRALNHRAWRDVEGMVRALNEYWDTRGLDEEAAAWADRILSATARPPLGPAEGARSLWLYVVNHQASRQAEAGRPDLAEQTYQQVLAWLHAQPASEWIRESTSVILQHLGNTAQARGLLDQADNWYRRSLTITEELGNRPGLARIYHQLGITAQARGLLDQADNWYRKSLTITEELGNRPYMAATYHQLGNTARAREQLDQADNWYRKSLTIREELGDRPHMSAIYHQLGITAQARAQLDQADNWYRKSLTITEELGNLSYMTATYHQLGTTAQARGQFDQADNWYRKSLALKEKLGDRLGPALTYAQLGLLAEERNQTQQALEWNIRCVSLFSEFPSPQTGTSPAALARLTRQLGLPALEQAWQQVTGQPLPTSVRDYAARDDGKEA